MRLRLTESSIEIATAINDFSRVYHDDFFEVRPTARRWIAEKSPTEATSGELVRLVRRVLGSWGAGKREAPRLSSGDDFAEALLHAQLHRSVGRLSEISNTALGFDVDRRRLVNGLHVSSDLKDFDENLLSVLREISRRLFVNNTNITYPLKVLLLISGLMPALDSQVRRGLGHAGFSGVNRTQFLLPIDTTSADAKKLTRLPFVLGQCWSDFATQFADGIRRSNFASLLQEPARVFDILLFMQADKEIPLLTLQSGSERWYDLA